MALTFGLVRPIAAGSIALGSILAGLSLAFRLVTPTQAAQLPTLELLGLLGLLALPPLTLWAMWADRKAANEAVMPQPEPVMADRIVEPKPMVFAVAEDEESAEMQPEVELHAPGRRAVRHRRHEPVRAGV